MNRRTLIGAGLASGALAPLASLAPPARAADRLAMELAEDHPLQQAWGQWKAAFLTPEGRVVDTFQNQVSHSEGQGYGLVLATVFRDAAAQDLIIAWTLRRLALRSDGLLAWRWQADTTPHVTDRNNASDGDIFFAWGLVLAAAQRDLPEHLTRATTMARAIVKRCSIPAPDGQGQNLLLPAVHGFHDAQRVVVNPSYYMPRAMIELAEATDTPALAQLANGGNALIDALAERGPMVPDWLALGATGVQPLPERFNNGAGYEAIRVPLFQIWSERGDSPAVRAFVRAAGPQPPENGEAAVVFSADDGRVTERSAHQGYAAIAGLAACVLSNQAGSMMPVYADTQPYYPATLHLMALVVQAVVHPRCVPL